MRIALRLKKQLRPEGEGAFIEKRATLRGQLLADSPSDDAEETYAAAATGDPMSGENDSLVWTEDPSSWNHGVGDEESWADDFVDSDDSWVVDVPEWDDKDPFVFGAGKRKENPV